MSLAFALQVGALGPSLVEVVEFRGKESMSALYAFDLVVVTTVPEELFERLVIGSPATFAFRGPGGDRCVSGLVSRVRHEGPRRSSSHEHHQYRLRLSPRALRLRHRRCTRVFQERRADQVITEVCHQAGVDVRFRLSKPLPERPYTTQYEETDYAFVRRLAAENGLLSYFLQPFGPGEALFAAMEAGTSLGPAGAAALSALASAAAPFGQGEAWVFTDEASHPPIAAGGPLAAAIALGAPTAFTGTVLGIDVEISAEAPAIPYRHGGALQAEGAAITSATLERRVRPTKAIFRTYDPDRPLTPLEAERPEAARPGLPAPSVSVGASGAPSVELGGVEELVGAGIEARDLVLYDHESRDHFPHWEHEREEPERILRQARRRLRVVRGTSTSVALEAGRRFRVEEHPAAELDRALVVTEVIHEGNASRWTTEATTPYQNAFVAVPADVPYVPARPARRSVQVCLTAVVVGPDEEEIHTDEQGRVQVKFHWDRRDQTHGTTCWIRCMQPWAGTGWGFQFIPRVGMEVVVGFENGDPDKPLVLGTVYNKVTPTPFQLPRDKTKSGVRTKSTPKSEGGNELSFEDAVGRERVYVHAERDLATDVTRERTSKIGADDRAWIGGNQILTVVQDQSETIQAQRTARVEGDDRLEVRGSRAVAVARDAAESIEGSKRTSVEGSVSTTVAGPVALHASSDLTADVKGSVALIVGRSDAPRSLAALVEGRTSLTSTGAITLHSEDEILLRVGSSFLRIASSGVEIGAASVALRAEDCRLRMASGEIKLAATSAIQLKSDDAIVLASSGAALGLTSEAKVSGSAIKLGASTAASDDDSTEEPEPARITVLDQDGNPVPYQRFVVKLDGGAEITGFLDEEGKATIPMEGTGEITFPDLAQVEE